MIAPQTSISADKYLQKERSKTAQAHKSELVNGKTIDISGASKPHNKLSSNLLALLWIFFQDGDFNVYHADLKVKNLSGNYYYPDLVIVNGACVFEDANKDIVTNPYMIIEILSDATESVDRGQKFKDYRSLPSLQEYILVAQDKYCIESFYRNSANQWIVADEIVNEMESFTFKSIELTLPLKSIYQRVNMGSLI